MCHEVFATARPTCSHTSPSGFVVEKKKKEEKETHKTLLMYNVISYPFHLWDAFRILEEHPGPQGREEQILLTEISFIVAGFVGKHQWG